MKRLAMTAVVLAASAWLATPALAQVQISVAPRLGLNLAKMTVEENGVELPDVSTRTAFHAGAELLVGLGSVFGLSSGAFYSQKGFEVEGGGQTATLKANYFSIPLLAGANIPLGPQSRVNPHVFGGGQLSFEATCDVEVDSQSDSCSSQGVDSESVDFGLLFGAGIGFSVGRGMLSVDGAYELGLRDLDKDPTVNAKHRVFYVSVGMSIPLGGAARQ